MAPTWLAVARSYLGTREVPGAGNSATVMGWAKALGSKVLGMVYNADSVPWCGLFMAQVMTQSGFTPPPVAVRAASWGKWGRELLGPRLGCVLVFQREGGGHVGLYLGERAADGAYRVLGGNQSDAVTETWVARNRLIKGGMRWPIGPALPAAAPVYLANDGKPLSSNEA